MVSGDESGAGTGVCCAPATSAPKTIREKNKTKSLVRHIIVAFPFHPPRSFVETPVYCCQICLSPLASRDLIRTPRTLSLRRERIEIR